MAENSAVEQKSTVGFGKTVRLVRIFGIDIEVDVSWLFIFILISVDLAVALFPRMHPFSPVSLHWTIAFATTLMFFATVLLHELAHALVALRAGIPVKKITLFLFGGVAGIEREPETARHEFLIAAAGPLVSVILGAGALLMGRNLLIESIVLFGPQGVFMNPVSTMFIWLGSANIMLAAFNLIPGFPLDGGRMLRAFIWGVSRRFLLATRISTLAGRGVSALLIGLGLAMTVNISLPFLQNGVGNGLWLMFIGWFLGVAAKRSWEQALFNNRLESKTAEEMVEARPVLAFPSDAIISTVLEQVGAKELTVIPVTENRMVIGTVALEQIRTMDKAVQSSTTLEEVMIPIQDIGVVAPEESALSVINRLKTTTSEQVAVIGDGQLRGLLYGRQIRRLLGLDDNYELNI